MQLKLHSFPVATKVNKMEVLNNLNMNLGYRDFGYFNLKGNFKEV